MIIVWDMYLSTLDRHNLSREITIKIRMICLFINLLIINYHVNMLLPDINKPNYQSTNTYVYITHKCCFDCLKMTPGFCV